MPSMTDSAERNMAKPICPLTGYMMRQALAGLAERDAVSDEGPSTKDCGMKSLFSLPAQSLAGGGLNRLDDAGKVRNNNHSQLHIYPIRADFYPIRYIPNRFQDDVYTIQETVH